MDASPGVAKHRCASSGGFRWLAWIADTWRPAASWHSYGVSLDGVFRQAADYVDRILRGANPAELPVEQPARYELILNMGTARALGLPISRSLLLRADRVLE